jgi:predicted transcriptional regulator
MLHLKDLMQRDVVAVSPDLTLRELVEVLTEQEVSGAPVQPISSICTRRSPVFRPPPARETRSN